MTRQEGLDSKYLLRMADTGVCLVTPVSQGEASYDESRKGGAGPGQ